MYTTVFYSFHSIHLVVIDSESDESRKSSRRLHQRFCELSDRSDVIAARAMSQAVCHECSSVKLHKTIVSFNRLINQSISQSVGLF